MRELAQAADLRLDWWGTLAERSGGRVLPKRKVENPPRSEKFFASCPAPALKMIRYKKIQIKVSR
ncbi:MAG: hypothetical protein CEE41_00075 [Hadesarchaea archaeon B3_Hades]|nr:MAG: hypothetical protein CEE41_00075 [Hadesarchaea archaeon B3_Hades]